jgi:hypothetical protein
MRLREGAEATSTAASGQPRRAAGGDLVRFLTGRRGDDGFVVTPAAFVESMKAAGVAGALDAIQRDAAAADPAVHDGLCREAVRLVRAAGPAPRVAAAVGNAYPALGIEDLGPARVVVTADEPQADPSAPVVRGLRAVLAAIVDRWAEAAAAGTAPVGVVVRTRSAGRS